MDELREEGQVVVFHFYSCLDRGEITFALDRLYELRVKRGDR